MSNVINFFPTAGREIIFYLHRFSRLGLPITVKYTVKNEEACNTEKAVNNFDFTVHIWTITISVQRCNICQCYIKVLAANKNF